MNPLNFSRRSSLNGCPLRICFQSGRVIRSKRSPMPFDDLRDFIKALEKAGELKRIGVEVDVELEIAEITDRVSKQNGRALLFENARGHSIPVLINALGTRKR